MTVRIPQELLPGDGRFGSGPSKVRLEAAAALADAGATYLGTSHRREGVRSVVRSVREGLTEQNWVAGLVEAELAKRAPDLWPARPRAKK